MATIESASVLATATQKRKAPPTKAASSAPITKQLVAAAKRVAKAAPTPAGKPGSAPGKTASATMTPDKSGASVKSMATKAANGKAPATKVTANPLPEAKNTKEKKQKMVRDSVTIPKAEYQALDAMKQRAAQLKTMVKKTELIRAGIKHLSSLPDTAFLAAIAAVPSLKTGRPSKG